MARRKYQREETFTSNTNNLLHGYIWLEENIKERNPLQAIQTIFYTNDKEKEETFRWKRITAKVNATKQTEMYPTCADVR